MTIRSTLILLTLVVWGPHPSRQDFVEAEPVRRCLENSRLAGLVLLTDTNPYYLRGDFDADGRPDHAIRVRRPSTGGNGVVVCSGHGAVSILGKGIGGDAFSDMRDDRFLARHWEVLSKEDVSALRAFSQNVPRPIPTVRAESIAMVWEDGICLIYWDGKRFRWAGSRSE